MATKFYFKIIIEEIEELEVGEKTREGESAILCASILIRIPIDQPDI